MEDKKTGPGKVFSWAVICLLAVNVFLLFSLKGKVDRLENAIDQTRIMADSNLREANQELSRQSAELEQIADMLEKSESLFQETAVETDLREGRLQVTVKAVPKVQTAGQQMIACVQAGDQLYQESLDEKGQAVLEMEMTSSIRPFLKVINGTETRTEYLDEVFPANQLAISFSLHWNEQEQLQLLFNSSAEEKAGGLGEGTFILVKTGQAEMEPGRGSGGGSASASLYESAVELPRELPAGICLPAGKVMQDDFAIYQGDFSAYAEASDGSQYQVYFAVETESGLTYLTWPNAAAEVAYYESGSSRGTLGSKMYPVITEGR